jgi:hypothetical protein
VTAVPRIAAPVLYQIAQHDGMLPAGAVDKSVPRTPGPRSGTSPWTTSGLSAPNTTPASPPTPATSYAPTGPDPWRARRCSSTARPIWTRTALNGAAFPPRFATGTPFAQPAPLVALAPILTGRPRQGSIRARQHAAISPTHEIRLIASSAGVGYCRLGAQNVAFCARKPMMSAGTPT